MYGFWILACATDPQLPTGMVEKYVHVIPEVVVFINIANDVLSLYKEMAAEEMGNCNDQRAQMEQCAVLTALQKVASEG